MRRGAPSSGNVRDIIASCLVLIRSVPYMDTTSRGLHPVSLVSIDADGFPSSRVVAPTSIADDLATFTINTREDTRKVREIRANPNVSLVWTSQPGRGGWLTLKGTATVGAVNKQGRLDLSIRIVRVEAMSYNQPHLQTDENGTPVILEMRDGAWTRAS
jgi:hypothetical protein